MCGTVWETAVGPVEWLLSVLRSTKDTPPGRICIVAKEGSCVPAHPRRPLRGLTNWGSSSATGEAECSSPIPSWDHRSDAGDSICTVIICRLSLDGAIVWLGDYHFCVWIFFEGHFEGFSLGHPFWSWCSIFVILWREMGGNEVNKGT